MICFMNIIIKYNHNRIFNNLNNTTNYCTWLIDSTVTTHFKNEN